LTKPVAVNTGLALPRSLWWWWWKLRCATKKICSVDVDPFYYL